ARSFPPPEKRLRSGGLRVVRSQTSPQLKFVDSNLQEAMTAKKKRQRTFIRCPVASYPPPGYAPIRVIHVIQVALVPHRGEAQATGVASSDREHTGRVVAHNAVISGAERLGAGLVADRRCRGVERVRQRSVVSYRGEDVTALARRSVRGGQGVVNQAAVSGSRNARSDAAGAQLGQRGIANRRIGAVIADFTDDDGVLGSGRGRIVGSHTGTEQVWNGDGCNDQDDGDHDQQLNQ